MDLNSLKYSGEQDRCYGVAGMTIALVAFDGEELLEGVSVEGDTGEDVALNYDFFFKGNPRMSAKFVWGRTVEHLQLSAAMMFGNLLCRRYVLGHQSSLDRETIDFLRTIVREEGRKICSLDDDESDSIFSRSFRDAERLFTHSAVHPMAHQFASIFAERRSLSAAEAIDILHRLGNR